MKFRKKPVVIEALTFGEFVEQGRKLSDNLVDGKSWSFEFNGHHVTHVTDDHYIINALKGNIDFRRSDILLIGINKEIYPCKIDMFNKTYEKVEHVSDIPNRVMEHMSNINPDSLTADGFDAALIGYAERCSKSALVVYDRAKCIEVLVDRDGMSYDEAEEFFEFNVMGAWNGEGTPLFLTLGGDIPC